MGRKHRSFLRRVRDSLVASTYALWMKLRVLLLFVSLVTIILVIFFSVAFRLLDVEPRSVFIEKQMRELDLLP